jgi:Ca-activated chloride channel family protein
MNCSIPTLAYFTLRLDQFSPLVALALFAGLGGIIVLLGIFSMAGMGRARKWVAIGVRLAVLLLVILILGDIKLVRKNTDVELMIVRDISRSTELVTDYPGKFLQSSIDDYLLTSTTRENSPSRREGDRVGEISFNEHAFIDAIPSPRLSLEARAIRDRGTGTDAAGAIQLGLASMGNDSMHRMLLIWDGNATAGDLNTSLAAASSQHVPIDVMPLHYNVEHEVMMDKFIAPSRRQEGQPFSIDVYINNKNAQNVEGDLSVTDNGKLLPLRDGKTTERVALKPGPNVERISLPAQSVGVHQFHSTITNIDNVDAAVAGDASPVATQLDNKSADSFTYIQGEGRVLLVDNTDPAHSVDSGRFLRQALASEKINVVSITPEQFPSTPIELQGYDAVILANVPRGSGGLSDVQETIVAQYVHDTGGGLVMIGGPDTFGAGGWEGSRLEQELPVTMEVPAQRQIPKGALVLIMDPAEAPDGNYWGEQCAIKSMEALSSQDEVGVISFAFSNGPGDRWDAPLEPKGDGSKVLAAIKNWELGDMPSFDQSIRLALDGGDGHPGLIASTARAKHIVIITDDDPQMPAEDVVQRMIDNKISVSTITIYPHQAGNVAVGIRELAKKTGGKSYGPFEGNLAPLPQIFIKEATVVKRSIIQEDIHGIHVSLAATSSDLVKGIPPGPLPPLYGYDLTGRRDNPLIEVPITAGPKRDPVLAHWQAGLGKVAVYTGDAFNRWDANWVGTGMYEKFWSQIVRGVSRSPFSSDFETDMTTDGDKGHIVVRAQKEGNAFNNFLNISGTVLGGADLTPHPIRLLQTGPGTYEADFDASAQGSYIGYLTYAGQDGKQGSLLAGTTVNSSPEMRDLQSNDALLNQIAERTGGRVLKPFDVSSADLFTRDGLAVTDSPQSIWDLLVPWLLALIILDVAVRRIAWDWPAIQRMTLTVANYVRQFTMTYRKVETPQLLDSLKRVREGAIDQKFRGATEIQAKPGVISLHPMPDPSAKFDAGPGVEGDITAVVGGATDKPIPSAPKNIEPKGAVGLGQHTGGLLEAKRRAQQKIKQQQEQN